MIRSNMKIRITAVLAVMLLAISSCDDFVEVDRPSGQLTRPAVFEDASTAEAALAHIYARMRDWGMVTGTSQSITTKLGAYTDEFAFYGPASSATAGFYNNALAATDATLTAWWREAYNQVYAANALIEGVSASGAIAQASRDRLVGEALFIRAYLHMQLSMVFGDVPYITSTDYAINTTIGKTPASDVLQKAITDLQDASGLVPEGYADAERIHPNRSAVLAMMARVCLYAGDWPASADAASGVINNTALYTAEDNLAGVFKKESSTTIWQYKPSQPGRNSAEGATFVLLAGPPSEIALSPGLLAAFEPGDLRRQEWVGSVSSGGSTWHYAFKYKERNLTSSSVEFSIQLRLAEQYLIRAEARARQGELVAALEDLNWVRAAAGLPDSTAATQGALLDAILAERRVEFFAEAGHRFFDLKRTGRLDTALTGLKPGWNSEDAMMPLPENEILLNPNLAPQNPGY